MEATIPVIDISYITEKYSQIDEWKSDKFKNDLQVKSLVERLSKNFSTWGFLYIKGHGIPTKNIENTFQEANNFFNLELDLKERCIRSSEISAGFVPSSGEVFHATKPQDLKEAFDYVPKSAETKCTDVFTFEQSPNLYNKCKDLSLKLLRLLAMALNIDMDHFVNLHSNIGCHNKNGTSMRLLYYPSIGNKESVKEHQNRCGEHTDYGTMTLLFQDDIGGLEVLSPSGNFVKASPIDDAIVINAGDLLQDWSNGKFPATVHKVSIPPENKLKKSRQSIAFFTHPDYDVTIDYVDVNGNKRQRNAYEHLKERFGATIKIKV